MKIVRRATVRIISRSAIVGVPINRWTLATVVGFYVTASVFVFQSVFIHRSTTVGSQFKHSSSSISNILNDDTQQTSIANNLSGSNNLKLSTLLMKFGLLNFDVENTHMASNVDHRSIVDVSFESRAIGVELSFGNKGNPVGVEQFTDSGDFKDNPSTSFVGGGAAKPETVVAIGLAITSRGVSGVNETSNFFAKFQFHHTFLPSFCYTASPGFTYRIYAAYDHTDRIFVDPRIARGFHRTFDSVTSKYCTTHRNIRVSLHLIRCTHDESPAWAQNDAMMEAYLDNVDYFYRVNDDTK